MHKTDVDKIRNHLNKVLSFVDPVYIKALLALQKTLEAEHIDWAVGGELSEALLTIQVEPDCIEIVTSKEGAEKIFLAVKQFEPKVMNFLTNKLLRNANIKGSQNPIYIRSYYFEFFLDGIKIKVQGDMQYKVNDWEWGDKLEFTPEFVNVTGIKIAVVPLEVKYEIYRNIGWTDRSQKIETAIKRRKEMSM